MLRLTKLSNKNKRRTLRALYAQTQGYPYGTLLSDSFDRTAGALSGGTAISGAKAAILPGLVAVKVNAPGTATNASAAQEVVTVSGAAGTDQRAFGLFANFVGGEMDELSDSNQVGVWRGAGSVWEVLAPAFDDTNLATRLVAEAGTVATEVYLNSGTKGQLVADAAGAKGVSDTARAIQRLSANAIVVELLV